MSMVDNDEDLLRDIVVLFIADCPVKISEIRSAIANCNSNSLMNAAHSLKGAVGNFAARSVFDCATRLEACGQKNDMETAAEDFALLQHEIDRLIVDLGRMVGASVQ